MDDCKSTKEGRIVGQKYADILQMERPEPSVKHPRMRPGQPGQDLQPLCGAAGFR